MLTIIVVFQAVRKYLSIIQLLKIFIRTMMCLLGRHLIAEFVIWSWPGAQLFRSLSISLKMVLGVIKMLMVVFTFMMDKTVAMTWRRSGLGFGVKQSSNESVNISDLSLEGKKSQRSLN